MKTNSFGMHLRCDIVDGILEVCRLQMEVDTELRDGRMPRRAGRRERHTLDDWRGNRRRKEG